MLIIYDAERELWDIRCGDVYFASTRTREQAQVLLEALDSGIDKMIDAAAAPTDYFAWDKGLFPAIEIFQRALVRQALHMAEGNKTQAAKLLKIPRTTFIEMAKRIDAEPAALLGE